jgi:hypothetical protein
VVLAKDKGWGTLVNGTLINSAEQAGFDLFITSDQNIAYQQNLSNRKIAIIVLGKGNWPGVRKAAARITEVVNSSKPGSYLFIDIP